MKRQETVDESQQDCKDYTSCVRKGLPLGTTASSRTPVKLTESKRDFDLVSDMATDTSTLHSPFSKQQSPSHSTVECVGVYEDGCVETGSHHNLAVQFTPSKRHQRRNMKKVPQSSLKSPLRNDYDGDSGEDSEFTFGDSQSQSLSKRVLRDQLKVDAEEEEEEERGESMYVSPQHDGCSPRLRDVWGTSTNVGVTAVSTFPMNPPPQQRLSPTSKSQSPKKSLSRASLEHRHWNQREISHSLCLYLLRGTLDAQELTNTVLCNASRAALELQPASASSLMEDIVNLSLDHPVIKCSLCTKSGHQCGGRVARDSLPYVVAYLSAQCEVLENSVEDGNEIHKKRWQGLWRVWLVPVCVDGHEGTALVAAVRAADCVQSRSLKLSVQSLRGAFVNSGACFCAGQGGGVCTGYCQNASVGLSNGGVRGGAQQTQSHQSPSTTSQDPSANASATASATASANSPANPSAHLSTQPPAIPANWSSVPNSYSLQPAQLLGFDMLTRAKDSMLAHKTAYKSSVPGFSRTLLRVVAQQAGAEILAYSKCRCQAQRESYARGLKCIAQAEKEACHLISESQDSNDITTKKTNIQLQMTATYHSLSFFSRASIAQQMPYHVQRLLFKSKTQRYPAAEFSHTFFFALGHRNVSHATLILRALHQQQWQRKDDSNMSEWQQAGMCQLTTVMRALQSARDITLQPCRTSGVAPVTLDEVGALLCMFMALQARPGASGVSTTSATSTAGSTAVPTTVSAAGSTAGSMRNSTTDQSAGSLSITSGLNSGINSGINSGTTLPFLPSHNFTNHIDRVQYTAKRLAQVLNLQLPSHTIESNQESYHIPQSLCSPTPTYSLLVSLPSPTLGCPNDLCTALQTAALLDSNTKYHSGKLQHSSITIDPIQGILRTHCKTMLPDPLAYRILNQITTTDISCNVIRSNHGGCLLASNLDQGEYIASKPITETYELSSGPGDTHVNILEQGTDVKITITARRTVLSKLDTHMLVREITDRINTLGDIATE